MATEALLKLHHRIRLHAESEGTSLGDYSPTNSNPEYELLKKFKCDDYKGLEDAIFRVLEDRDVPLPAPIIDE